VDRFTALTPRGASTLIPKDPYISPAFAALEQERLWPRVWQIACTVDHVAQPGDFFEYRAGWISVLVVRSDDGGLRAFQNVCRHRGNTICAGAGAGLVELRCPFHRWAWDLTGRLREIPSRGWFGALDDDDLGLFPVHVDTWGPLVFVNLATDAEPLRDFLEGVPVDAEWARLDEFRCTVTTSTPVDCNWKVVVDGFSETYHIQGIHREMLGSIDDIHATQHLWHRHGVSYQDYGVASPRLGPETTDEEIWESFVVTQGGRMGPEYATTRPMPPRAPGESVRDLIARLLREEHARSYGTRCDDFDTAQMLRLSQYNVFPNATVLVWGEMMNVLLARPGATPDDAHFATFLLYRAPAADAPRVRPAGVPVPADADFGYVLNADVGVLKTAQRGLHQPGLTHLVVSAEECRLLNMHRALAAYLDRDGEPG
jgi:phenylpropionate dioxygenase-like ring-hydroxylating dioxygenase large terminal subunit